MKPRSPLATGIRVENTHGKPLRVSVTATNRPVEVYDVDPKQSLHLPVRPGTTIIVNEKG